MRTSMRMLPVALGVSLLLTACSSGSGSTPSPTPSPAPTTLAGTSWTLTSYAPVGSTTTRRVPIGVEATADFSATDVSGSGGCNNYSATYTLDGGTIDIGPAGSTLKFCPPPSGTVEVAFLQQLDAATRYAIDGTTLTLSDASRNALLVFTEATPAALVGPTWTASGINNGKQAVASPVAGSTVTARFGTNGTVSGSGGCNNYSGPYTSATTGSGKGTLTFGNQNLTQKICTNTAVSQQESNYLGALANAATYRITGKTLQVRDSDGALLVSYTTR